MLLGGQRGEYSLADLLIGSDHSVLAGRGSELQILGVDFWSSPRSEECLLAFVCFKILGSERRPEFILIPLGGARLLEIAS